MSEGSRIPTANREFTLSLTESAVKRVAEIAAGLGYDRAVAGLRVGVVEGGCSGLNYDVKVVDAPAGDETVHVCNGARVFVSDFSAPYVNGMSVDWVSSFQESRFVFQNPNSTGGCGCGVSFTVD